MKTGKTFAENVCFLLFKMIQINLVFKNHKGKRVVDRNVDLALEINNIMKVRFGNFRILDTEGISLPIWKLNEQNA